MLALLRRIDARGGSLHAEDAYADESLGTLCDASGEGLISSPSGWVDWYDMTERGEQTLALNAARRVDQPVLFPPTKLERLTLWIAEFRAHRIRQKPSY